MLAAGRRATESARDFIAIDSAGARTGELDALFALVAVSRGAIPALESLPPKSVALVATGMLSPASCGVEVALRRK